MSRGQKNVKFYAVLTAMIVSLGFSSGCAMLPEEEAVLAPPLVQPKQQKYELHEVTRKDITNRLVGVGHAVSSRQDELVFKEGGKRLKKIYVKRGETVNKGDVLMEVDTGNLEYRLALQENTLKKVELMLKKLKDMEASSYDIQAAELDVKTQRLIYDELKGEYDRARLISPVNGVVTFIENLKEGDYVEPFKTLITISDPRELQIIHSSINTNKIVTGMSVELTHGGKKFEGEVVTSPQDIPLTGVRDNMRNAIIITSKNLPAEVKMGDMIDINITYETKKDTIVIPLRGLRSYKNKNFVQVMDGNSKKELNVEIGIQTAVEVEILAGLEEGQMVILR